MDEQTVDESIEIASADESETDLDMMAANKKGRDYIEQDNL